MKGTAPSLKFGCGCTVQVCVCMDIHSLAWHLYSISGVRHIVREVTGSCTCNLTKFREGD